MSPPMSLEARKRISLSMKGNQRHKGHHHSIETKAKLSQLAKGRIVSDETKLRMSMSLKGHSVSEETREKMRNSSRNQRHSINTRRKLSKDKICAIKEGRFHPERNSINGDFYSSKNKRTLHYRSLLELHWYQLLEKMSKVKRYHVEPVAIPYKFDDSVHHYLPDLRIRYVDGTTELVEIKPEGHWTNAQNQAKWAAAQRWCEGRRIPTSFRVVGYGALKEGQTQ